MDAFSGSEELLISIDKLTGGERDELIRLGILSEDGGIRAYVPPPHSNRLPLIHKRAIHAPELLSEAFQYAKPSSFSRGLRLDIGGVAVLIVSGTASVDEKGETVHVGDFGAQCWRTYRNISGLLETEGASWHDVVRTTCYLRDIKCDYDEFNRIRTSFFRWLGLDPLPASVGVEARLCREDLLVEIDAVAIFHTRAGD